MNTKQFFSAMAAALVLCAASLNAKTADARQGYFGLKWGTSTRDAENAKHKLTRLSLAEEKRLQAANGYPETVMIYDIAPDTKKVQKVVFYYYNDRLFMVNETMAFDGKQKTLESRYGSFKDIGVSWKNGVYTDETRDTDGNIRSRSIAIDTTAAPGMVSVTLCDWAVCKMLNDAAKENGTADDPFITEFKAMAQKLAPEKKSGTKPSYAVVTLTTDNRNPSIETYVTDALTEAVFDTGTVRIIERANLENILSEQQFQSSGLVNEDTAKAIGSIAGADYVCYGTIKDSGTTLLVSARVVDVENGEICAMSRAAVQKDDYVNAHINDKPVPKPQTAPQAKPATETTTAASTEAATAVATNAPAQPAEEHPAETPQPAPEAKKPLPEKLEDGTYTILPKIQGWLGALRLNVYLEKIFVANGYMILCFTGDGNRKNFGYYEKITLQDAENSSVKYNQIRTDENNNYFMVTFQLPSQGRHFKLYTPNHTPPFLMNDIVLDKPDDK
ncbi:MAG: hypothetical protein HDR38_03700 [Treponema sp.]|nr:hypothetical protein [Treponema sp.]